MPTNTTAGAGTGGAAAGTTAPGASTGTPNTTAGATAGSAGGAGGVTAGSSSGPGTGMLDAGSAPMGVGSCEAESGGVFAFKASVDVWWGRDGAITEPGRGIVTQYFMTNQAFPNDALEFTGMLTGCGAVLPPFHASPICESYQANFATWETVPSIPITGKFDCLDAGCTASMDPTLLMIGMSLPNDEDPWPQPDELSGLTCPEGSLIDCFPDDDQDGKPGVTTTMTLGGVSVMADPSVACGLGLADRVYSGSPPGPIDSLIPGAARIKELYLGLRVGMAGGITTNADCTGGEGYGSAQYIDARAIDCLMTDDTPCTTAGSAFSDEQLPVYHPLNAGDMPPAMVGSAAIEDTSASLGPKFEAVRLGEPNGTFTCADVAAAF